MVGAISDLVYLLLRMFNKGNRAFDDLRCWVYLRIYTLQIPPEIVEKWALRWSSDQCATAWFVHLNWMNEDNLFSWTKYALAHSFMLHLRANFLESIYSEFTFYGSTNYCARTDTAFFPISEVSEGLVSLSRPWLQPSPYSLATFNNLYYVEQIMASYNAWIIPNPYDQTILKILCTQT